MAERRTINFSLCRPGTGDPGHAIGRRTARSIAPATDELARILPAGTVGLADGKRLAFQKATGKKVFYVEVGPNAVWILPRASAPLRVKARIA